MCTPIETNPVSARHVLTMLELLSKSIKAEGPELIYSAAATQQPGAFPIISRNLIRGRIRTVEGGGGGVLTGFSGITLRNPPLVWKPRELPALHIWAAPVKGVLVGGACSDVPELSHTVPGSDKECSGQDFPKEISTLAAHPRPGLEQPT